MPLISTMESLCSLDLGSRISHSIPAPTLLCLGTTIVDMHVSQLSDIKKLGIENMDNSPTLVGECGIPYDTQHFDTQDNSHRNYGQCPNSTDLWGIHRHLVRISPQWITPSAVLRKELVVLHSMVL